jgi:serine protease Do
MNAIPCTSLCSERQSDLPGRSFRHAFLALVVTCTAALLPSSYPAEKASSPQLKTDARPLANVSGSMPSLAPMVKRASQSVVNIYTAKTVRENSRIPMDDLLLRHFLGLQGGYQSIPRERREQSLGSGVIVSQDGYILTNNHVVESADEIRVALSDDRKIYNARIVGTDPQTDVAVIKVDANDLPAITVADSDQLQTGDMVLAIGNPFGVGQAVTMGIVSAKGRGGMGIVDYEDFIQTDASINPGNSGGALVDLEGRLVGINSAILSQSGGNLGIGFAIPINLARSVMQRLVADGKVSRGYLGATFQPLTAELAQAFNVPGNAGALVAYVAPRSPAEQAGVREGDIVIEFNGSKVADHRQLRLLGSETAPGVEVSLKVMRYGGEHQLHLTLGRSPSDLTRRSSSQVPFDHDKRPSPAAGPLDSLIIEGIDGRMRRQFNFPPSLRGVVIVEVSPVSPAAIAGLRAGDVILEIDREHVANVDDAIKLSRSIQNNRTLLRVWSNGTFQYVVVHGTKEA